MRFGPRGRRESIAVLLGSQTHAPPRSPALPRPPRCLQPVLRKHHPSLGHLVHLQKSTRIKYRSAARGDVTAHAALTPLQVAAIEQGADSVEVQVAVLDADGHAVAELVSRFALRR